MTVRELITLLETFADDLPVHTYLGEVAAVSLYPETDVVNADEDENTIPECVMLG